MVYADNKSMITMCSEFLGCQSKAKHYMQRLHYMLELTRTGVIRLEHRQSLLLNPDGLTKPLSGAHYDANRELLMGRAPDA